MSNTQSDESPDEEAVFPFVINSLSDRGQIRFCKNLLVNLFEPGISQCKSEVPDIKIKRQIIEHYLKDICSLTQQYGIYTIEISTPRTIHGKYVIQTDDIDLEFTMIYQGIRLPCKNDQGYCCPKTRTPATIVWFSEDTCTTFQVAKTHARMIKFHEKYFIESIPYDKVNPFRKQSTDFKNIHDKENKLTRFQVYHETEFACKYSNPLYKTQYSEILVEYEKGFDLNTGKIKFDPHATSHPINKGLSYVPVNFYKSTGQPGGKLKPYDNESTRLQELSLMNSTYFGNIHYDFHLDMKLDYTIS